jgi:ABC-type bacteriocin/lantibiotic exporter with double-glycine peptidase domain
LLDALKGYVEGNIYQRNHFFHNRFGVARKLFSEHLFKSLSVQAMPNRIIEVFATLGLFILIVIAKWAGMKDNSSLITIGAFMAATYKIIPGIVKIINTAGQMKIHESSISVMEVFKKKSNEHIEPTNEPIQSIVLSKLKFKYEEQEVLNDFSMTVNRGDFIGITGKSGKGKSTVFNLLLGFLTPLDGNIFINGSPVSTEKIKDYWSQVSYVRQQPFLIHDTIFRNITFEEEGDDEKALELVLKISGLIDMIDQSPDGLDKIITENGKNISGGQQQRIAIARAFYKNAELILLDEPFNELDEASTILLLQHLKDISSKGKMVVMITHDKKCLSYCNKIISLDEQ